MRRHHSWLHPMQHWPQALVALHQEASLVAVMSRKRLDIASGVRGHHHSFKSPTF
jgi:hypothetical protein